MKPYIKIYNCLLEEKSEYNLTVEEFYLYCLLDTLKNIEQKVIVNVDLIYYESLDLIPFFSRETEAKKRIREHLQSLVDKKVIEITNNKEVNNKSNLHIRLSSFKGYDGLSFDQFREFTRMIDLYIHCIVARFDNDKFNGFRCNYARWSTILNCTEKTAKRTIKDLVDREIIYKNTGDYISEMVNGRDQKRQDDNTYRINPFSEEEKTHIQKKIEHSEIVEEVVSEKINDAAVETIGENDKFSSVIEKSIISFREFEIKGKPNFPDSEDYYQYFVAKEALKNNSATKQQKELLKEADNRINILFSKEGSKYLAKKEMDAGEELFYSKDHLNNESNSLISIKKKIDDAKKKREKSKKKQEEDSIDLMNELMTDFDEQEPKKLSPLEKADELFG
ncbi:MULTISPECIES: hypothetical protein [Bacillaceae]|uniref:DnaD domain-containing protein n=1 Tax=Evansella alkalicola TaxID=745819 RepID=A0ABS6JZW3_9BACI|nr:MULTISPECIES: hypothetical protein [Bacillaceae]MBU9724142.1 hypothetical protein [Bacillus alkalicola]